MSKIDEALARARKEKPVVPGDERRDTEFPLEPGEERVVPTSASPVPVIASTPEVELAVSDAAAPAGPAAPAAPSGSELLAPAADSQMILSEKLIAGSRDSATVEQYRRLAARLYLAQAERPMSVVMVTSALPGEGKTLTAANLALTLSESYRRQVLLVDADLRRPCLHELFRLPNVTGLNDGLRSDSDRKVPVIRLTDHLTVLTAGRPESDPMSALSSDRMRRVLEEAGSTFEWVIIDTPPVGLLSDARLMTSVVDTVLLVVQAGKTPIQAIQSAIAAIGRDRILGVVLNRADQKMPGAPYHYDYYGETREQA